jgi:hypothetical protein
VGVIEDLPVLAGDDFWRVVAVGVEQLAEAEQHLRARGDRILSPLGRGLRRSAHDPIDILTGPNGTRATTSPVADSVTSP